MKRPHVRHGSLVKKTAARKPNIYNCIRNTELCTRKRAILKLVGKVRRVVFRAVPAWVVEWPASHRRRLLRDRPCLRSTIQLLPGHFGNIPCCSSRDDCSHHTIVAHFLLLLCREMKRFLFIFLRYCKVQYAIQIQFILTVVLVWNYCMLESIKLKRKFIK